MCEFGYCSPSSCSGTVVQLNFNTAFGSFYVTEMLEYCPLVSSAVLYIVSFYNKLSSGLSYFKMR